MKKALAAFAFAVLTLPGTAAASIWVVDDDGGAGVDFTNFADAIAAAAPGDTLVVMPGTYIPFTLTKPLRIVGQTPGPYPSINGAITVRDIPAGTFAALAALSIDGLQIVLCAGTVVCDSLEGVVTIRVGNSVDARLRLFTNTDVFGGVPPRLRVENSRVELIDTELTGAQGSSFMNCPPSEWQAGDGHAAAVVVSGELFATRSTLRGGRGGGVGCLKPVLCFADAGNGGPGLVLGSGAYARLAGFPSQSISGGLAGDHNLCSFGHDGEPGDGAQVGVGAVLEHSGLSIESIENSGGTVIPLVPPAPMLSLLEVPQPGSNLSFRVSGIVGASVRLEIAARPNGPGEGISGGGLAARRVFSLGEIPPGGVVGHNLQLSPTVEKGTVLFARARVSHTDGTTEWTNSIPVIVR